MTIQPPPASPAVVQPLPVSSAVVQPPPASSTVIERRAFIALLVIVSVAFFWILRPYAGAVLWGAIIALLSVPVFRRLLARLNHRRSLAALLTLLATLVVVVLPLTFVAGSLVRQSVSVFQSIQSGQLDLGQSFQQVVAALPDWLVGVLDRAGLVDFAALRERVVSSAARISQIAATQALGVGQLTLDFLVDLCIALYLGFFLLRDGPLLASRIRRAIPLNEGHKRDLLVKFVTVIRATVKGNILVAATQGFLGGVAFWFLGIPGALLWGTLMAFLSLLPAIGAALVWLPVAGYFIATGDLLRGFGLVAYGVLVIGLVDNVLRPILVGKDTKMPDYVVLISTLGGLAVFGLNGFVIGPVIAAMFIAAWDLFSSDRREAAITNGAAEAPTGVAPSVGIAPATGVAPSEAIRPAASVSPPPA